MQDNKQIKPHDAYIKKYLQDPRAARDFFQIHLEQQVCKLIDFETLVLTNKSFVKANSTQIHSDMVFRFHSKDQHAGYLYVLLEQVRHEVARIKSAQKGVRLHSNLGYHYFGAMLATV